MNPNDQHRLGADCSVFLGGFGSWQDHINVLNLREILTLQASVFMQRQNELLWLQGQSLWSSTDIYKHVYVDSSVRQESPHIHCAAEYSRLS